MVKITSLPNLIYRFIIIPIRIPTNYFMNMDKLTLKFKWRGKTSRIANIILKEKNRVGELTLPTSGLIRSHRSQDSVLLEKEQIKKSKEQNRDPRNTLT